MTDCKPMVRCLLFTRVFTTIPRGHYQFVYSLVIVSIIMSEMNEAEEFFMSEIELALVPLIECINENYDPNYSRQDLEISYDPKRKMSMSYGGRIVFSKVQGWNHGGLEYKMFEKDADLWTHGINSLKFRAWWLTAHEISHEIYGRIFGKCHSIEAPCTENACERIVGSTNQNDWPQKLLDLINNQAYWKKYQSGNQYGLAMKSYTPHNIFFQHIYRTLRREVVNPRFGIEVGPWKQRKYSPPKKPPRSRFHFIKG